MNNYQITFFYGQNDNQRVIEIYDVKTIAYDKDVVYFFGEDDKPKFILKHDKYFIGKI
jgi:hypothetical protein